MDTTTQRVSAVVTRPLTPTTSSSRRRKPVAVPIGPDNPLLTYEQVAQLLTELGSPAKANTVRTYKRVGSLPLPDVQAGGEDYGPGETVKSYHRRTRPPKEPDPQRPWTVRERNGASCAWLRSTIVAWNEGRRGPGRWKGKPADRAKEIARRAPTPAGKAAVAATVN